MCCAHQPLSWFVICAMAFKRSITKQNNSRKNIVSIPYVHKIAHNLKNVGSRYGLVVFSAPSKLGKICAGLDSVSSRKKNLALGSHNA